MSRTLKQALGLAIFSWLLSIGCIAIMFYGFLETVTTVRKDSTLVWERVNVPTEIKEQEEIEVVEVVEVLQPEYVIEVTPSEVDLMARVVMSESSILSTEGKQAVAETIINRVLSDDYPDTVSEVVYQPNAYSTHWNGSPTAECYQAVRQALENPVFPDSMIFICSEGYHSYGYPYTRIGNMFFSTTEDVTTYHGEEIDKD